LSKNKIKLFNSLKLRKYRKKHRLFFAEGEKTIKDLLTSDYKCKYIVLNSERNFELDVDCEIIYSDLTEMNKITALKTSSGIIAYFEFKEENLDLIEINNSLSLFLDDIQDPGNMGTIIRTAEWFGIKNVICSLNTVDIYNPKVIQATMGALAGVNIKYVESNDFFNNIADDLPVYGTFMIGENIYQSDLSEKGIIIMGNEGKGISDLLECYISKRLSVPSMNPNEKFSESLNVSAAVAVICSEFNRNKLKYKS